MRYFCEIHNMDIIVYDSHESEFKDDNKEETSIVNGKLKRYRTGKCDDNCPTVRSILNSLKDK